jgi:anti-anti-sigma regulatory factor
MLKQIVNNKLVILEPIVTIQNATEIINAIEEISKNYDNITIELKNTFSFPSSIISVLEKLKEKGKDIKIIVYDNSVYELFQELGLAKTFKVVKE